MTSSNKFSQNIAGLHCHVARMALLLCGPVQSSWKRRRGGRESGVSCRENAVGRASDGAWAPVQDVCVDHGGADILVAEEFLNCPNVVAVLQLVGGKGVAKHVAAHALGDARSKGGDPDGTLEDGFVKVMTSAFAGGPVEIHAGRREHPLPGPLVPGVGVLPGESPRQLDPARAGLEIDLMLVANRVQVPKKIGLDGDWQHREAVLVALACAHHKSGSGRDRRP